MTGQSQIEIARSVSLDASSVSRYLKRARDKGVVRVEIQRPRSLHGDVALELAESFHLKLAAADDASQPRGETDRLLAGLSAGRFAMMTLEVT